MCEKHRNPLNGIITFVLKLSKFLNINEFYDARWADAKIYETYVSTHHIRQRHTHYSRENQFINMFIFVIQKLNN